jgi:hypothetical protein
MNRRKVRAAIPRIALNRRRRPPGAAFLSPGEVINVRLEDV